MPEELKLVFEIAYTHRCGRKVMTAKMRSPAAAEPVAEDVAAPAV
jgi:hypothetical protein